MLPLDGILHVGNGPTVSTRCELWPKLMMMMMMMMMMMQQQTLILISEGDNTISTGVACTS